MKDLTMTGRVPADVLEAAAKVEQWAYLEGGDGWRVMGLADRRLTDRLEAKVEMLTAKLARNHPSRHEGETHAQSILANRRWREAVYDACTVAHIGWDAGDPRKTIDQLIDWHVQVALDPKVSEPMANLTAQVRHWKANHNHLAARTALLLQRPDLPVDRIPAYRELERLQEAVHTGAVRLNVIEDATVPPNTMIIEDGRQSFTITGITKEFIEGVATDRMTEFKADSIMKRGYRKVGYVLLNDESKEFAIVSQSAVRWLAQPHMWRLMHEQDGSLFGTGGKP